MARNRKQKRELYSRKAGSPKKFYRGLRLASRKGLCLARRLASIHYYRPPFHTRGWPDRTSRLVIISILQIQRNFHPTFDTPREKKKRERRRERSEENTPARNGWICGERKDGATFTNDGAFSRTPPRGWATLIGWWNSTMIWNTDKRERKCARLEWVAK